jgi:hypothetical protein
VIHALNIRVQQADEGNADVSEWNGNIKKVEGLKTLSEGVQRDQDFETLKASVIEIGNTVITEPGYKLSLRIWMDSKLGIYLP